MKTSDYDVQTAIFSTVVHYRKFTEALKVFNRLVEFCERSGKGQGFLLMGESSNGKTVLANEMCHQHPWIQEEERVRIKVIMISMPANPTIRSFCMKLLDSFGRKYGERDTEAKLNQEVVTLLKNCGTVMLIVDEAQHLIDGNKINKTPAEVADWIKQLMNDSKVSVTLIGTPRVEVLLSSNSQLRSRFSRKIVLDGYSVQTPNDKQLLCNTVGRLLQDSGYAGDASYIYDPTALDMLYYATDGRLGYIAKLLAEAIWISQSRGANDLTSNDFCEAFKTVVWFDAAPDENPFSGEFEPRELVNLGEPFYTGKLQ